MKGRKKESKKQNTSMNEIPIIRYPYRMSQFHKRLLWIIENHPDGNLSYRDIKRLKRVESDIDSLGRIHEYMHALRALGAIDFADGQKFMGSLRIIFYGNLYDLLKEVYARENFLMFYIDDSVSTRVHKGSSAVPGNGTMVPSGETVMFRSVFFHKVQDGKYVLTCRHAKSRVHKVVGGWNGDEILNNERYWDKTYWITDKTYGEFLSDLKDADKNKKTSDNSEDADNADV